MAPTRLVDRPPIVAPPPLNRQNNQNSRRKQLICPSKTCMSTRIEDGACTECGIIVEEYNIVSEVQFGETSSGAAMVQGTYLSADQGGATTMGIGGRGDGGGSRKATMESAKFLMNGLQHSLQIGPSTVEAGLNIFKLAATMNFIQGRQIRMVAAVCLYSACRQARPCRVMLIDFADHIAVNVFKLGVTFTALQKAIPMAGGILPILPEDLIHRFASKLEFGDETDKVAEDAVRMVKRMSLDWMVMGRRPSGVCGACLIIAARMNNFRRTITEVVYIVKVTTHTIQKRLEEFKLTPSSALTVEEFLHNEFLESAHDPPSFYEKTEEFQKTKKKRKRKHAGPADEEENSESDPNKRQKTATPGPDQNVELRRDADGFAIPPIPNRAATPVDLEANIDPSLRSADTTVTSTQPENATASTTDTTPSNLPVGQLSTPPSPQSEGTSVPAIQSETTNQAAQADEPTSPPPSQLLPTVEKPANVLEDILDDETEENEQIAKLVNMYSGEDGARVPSPVPEQEEDEEDEDEDEDELEEVNPRKGKKGPDNRPIRVDEQWDRAEQTLESEISEIINDPNTTDHAEHYAIAKQRAAATTILASRENPQREISMDVHIGEDEFENDPEVMNCLLSEADSLIKEKLWVNENKTWLRKQQLREVERKIAEAGPPKAKRNRIKKKRIGENQTEPAASPGEAAATAMKTVAYSKKINYKFVEGMFDIMAQGTLGSAATSRVTSHAGSTIGSEDGSEHGSRASSLAPSSRAGSMAPDMSPLDLFTRPAGKRNRERSSRTPVSKHTPRASPVPIAPRPSQEPSSARSTPARDLDTMSDSFDYVAPTPARAAPARRDTEEVVEDWRAALKQAKVKAPGDDGEEDEPEYGGDYDDVGDLEPGGLGDFDDEPASVGEGGFEEEEEVDYDEDMY